MARARARRIVVLFTRQLYRIAAEVLLLEPSEGGRDVII
jgi:hypothetical protein